MQFHKCRKSRILNHNEIRWAWAFAIANTFVDTLSKTNGISQISKTTRYTSYEALLEYMETILKDKRTFVFHPLDYVADGEIKYANPTAEQYKDEYDHDIVDIVDEVYKEKE